jgi:tetratricopeptide (TPR) repeat protein
VLITVRYLHEAAMLTDSKRLLEVAFSNCQDEDSIEYAEISDGAGALACEFAHYDTAEKHFRNVLSNRERHFPSGCIEISFALSALAFILPGAWRVDEAIEIAEMSLKFLEDDSIEDPTKWHPDRLLRNAGRAWLCKENTENAEKYFQDAEDWATRIFGKGSYYHAE